MDRKVELHSYDSNFKEMFESYKSKIRSVLDYGKIFWVGSTSIPNLGGKGVIDILIVVDKDKIKAVVNKIKPLGFNEDDPEDNPTHAFLFNAKVESRKGDTHIHVMSKGNPRIITQLVFRDYMRDNTEEAKIYDSKKAVWAKEANLDRPRYTELKRDYIKSVLEKAKTAGYNLSKYF